MPTVTKCKHDFLTPEAMTELEKMLAGMLYRADDPTLIAMRTRARALFTRYNQTQNTDATQRADILRDLLGTMGSTIDIQPPFYCDYGTNIHLGTNVFINYNCTILDCGRVEIGDNVFVAPSVSFYAAHHPVIASERIKGPELAGPIIIENNVWLGGGVILCSGVRVGANSTIGAGSIVTRSVPANVLAAGNPCRVIRSLPD